MCDVRNLNKLIRIRLIKNFQISKKIKWTMSLVHKPNLVSRAFVAVFCSLFLLHFAANAEETMADSLSCPDSKWEDMLGSYKTQAEVLV